MSDQGPRLEHRAPPGEGTSVLLATLQGRWLAQRALASRRRLWSASLAVLAVVALDPFGLSLGVSNGRFLLVLLPLFAVFVVRVPHDPLTIRRPEGPDRLVGVLFVLGLTGSAYGLLFVHPHSPAFGVFLPMGLAFLHLTSFGAVQDHEAWRCLRWLCWICAAYVCLHVATVSGLLPDFSGGTGPSSTVDAVFSHEKAFLTAVAPVAAWLLGRRALAAVLVVLCGVIFVDYPAGTYVVAAVIAAITVVVTGRRPGRARALVMGLLVVSLVGLMYDQVTTSSASRSSTLVGSYFEAVKKTDSTSVRADLWGKAIDDIRKSPLVGSVFSGNISLRQKLSGRFYKVPVHNDFLLVGMVGGLLGMALLVGWVVATNVTTVRRYWELTQSGRSGPAHLVRALLVGFNTFFAVAFFNPVMTQVGLSAAVMVMYSMIRAVESPEISDSTR